MRNPWLIPIASGLFSMGFFSLSFSFPLLADRLHYSTGEIGLLGIATGTPFPIITLLMVKFDSIKIFRVLRFSILFMVPVSILFIFFASKALVPLIASADILAAAYFISAEMGIGVSDTDNLAEHYSAAWGIPNLIAPAIAGFVLQSYSFEALYIMTVAFFILTIVFIPRHEESVRSENRRNGKASMLLVLPMLFGGMSAGFFYYVIIPYLKISGLTYIVVGIVGSIPPLVSALVFLLLGRIRSQVWIRYSIVSALLLSAPLLLFLSHQIISLSILFALTGSGSAIAFSKILSYISRTTSATKGIFYYETLFGIGFITGSISGGFLFQYIGYMSGIVIYTPALIYAISLLIASARSRSSLMHTA